MISINKKQVGQIIKIMKRCENRPSLKNLFIQKIGDDLRLCFTDSYIFGSWKLSINTDLVVTEGHGITFEDLDRWYKLSDGKETINEYWVLENMKPIKSAPDFNFLTRKEETKIEKICMDAKYLLETQILAGGQVQLIFTGQTNVIKCYLNDYFGIILPIRLK